MSSILARGPESDRHDRAISSLADRAGASPAVVRALFMGELSRLRLGARVRSYLQVLTTSNVRAMLRREASTDDVARREDTASSSLRADLPTGLKR